MYDIDVHLCIIQVYCTCTGVGGIEVEDVMLGHPLMMTLPRVVGCRLVGKPGDFVTSTDLVLAITKVRLRTTVTYSCSNWPAPLHSKTSCSYGF